VHDIAWKCAYTSISSYAMCCTHVIVYIATTLMKRTSNEEYALVLCYIWCFIYVPYHRYASE